MGQFSWIYSDTNKQMLDDVYCDSYLLVPPEFENQYGKFILEKCYDGYGNFGKYDVYDLVAEWNKIFIPTMIKMAKSGKWKCDIREKDIENLMNFYNDLPIACEKRWLGIIMACYNDDNYRLPYPIKITRKPMEYARARASEADPNQGWEY